MNIPLDQLPQAIDMIPGVADHIEICQHAVLSKRFIDYLESQQDFHNLINLGVESLLISEKQLKSYYQSTSDISTGLSKPFGFTPSRRLIENSSSGHKS